MPKYKRKSNRYKRSSKEVTRPAKTGTAKTGTTASTASDSNTNMFIVISVIFSIVSIIYQLTQLSDFVTKKGNKQDDNQPDNQQGSSNLDKPANPIIIIMVICALVGSGILLDYLLFGESRIFRNLYLLLRTFY